MLVFTEIFKVGVNHETVGIFLIPSIQYVADRQATHRLIRQPPPIGEIANVVKPSADLA
jgi:hypothetical protein